MRAFGRFARLFWLLAAMLMAAGSYGHAHAEDHCAVAAEAGSHENSPCGDSSSPSVCHFCCHAHGAAIPADMTPPMAVVAPVRPHGFFRARIPAAGAIPEIEHPPQLS
ncbi:MAG: hypothetical protein ACO3YO_07800 [Chthoniobacterales bacterium]|jgi:hypothetical protein